MSVLDRFDQSKAPANKRDILPLYCGRSGHHLERVTQAMGFDTATGQERFRYWLACPNAPRGKESPYRPSYVYAEKARYVACDLRAWAEPVSSWQHLAGYVDCSPWPEPIVTVTAGPTSKKTKP